MDTRERCVPMYVRSHVHMVVHGPHSHSVRGTSMLTRTQAHARTHALVLQPSSRATVQTLVPLAALYRALYELQTDVTSAGYSPSHSPSQLSESDYPPSTLSVPSHAGLTLLQSRSHARLAAAFGAARLRHDLLWQRRGVRVGGADERRKAHCYPHDGSDPALAGTRQCIEHAAASVQREATVLQHTT